MDVSDGSYRCVVGLAEEAGPVTRNGNQRGQLGLAPIQASAHSTGVSQDTDASQVLDRLLHVLHILLLCCAVLCCALPCPALASSALLCLAWCAYYTRRGDTVGCQVAHCDGWCREADACAGYAAGKSATLRFPSPVQAWKPNLEKPWDLLRHLPGIHLQAPASSDHTLACTYPLSPCMCSIPSTTQHSCTCSALDFHAAAASACVDPASLNCFPPFTCHVHTTRCQFACRCTVHVGHCITHCYLDYAGLCNACHICAVVQ